MPNFSPRARRFIVVAGSMVLASTAVDAQVSPAKSHFSYSDPNGKTQSVSIISKFSPRKIVYPFAKVGPNIDPKLCRAATIAEERARAHSRSRCWHYVKEALLASGAINSRPTSEFAKDAA